jgi:hypothetical protein
MDVDFDILSAVILCYSVTFFDTHICGNTQLGNVQKIYSDVNYVLNFLVLTV